MLDGPQKLGAFLRTVGGGGFVRIDRDLIRPKGNEVGANLEREIVQGLSGRLSYVYKNARDVWGEVDVVRAPLYTVPYTIIDPGPDNQLGTGDEQTFQTFDCRPARTRTVFTPTRRATTTLYNYKLIGRYTLPFDVGLSGSWKLPSGVQWGRTISVPFPGDGSRTVAWNRSTPTARPT